MDYLICWCFVLNSDFFGNAHSGIFSGTWSFGSYSLSDRFKSAPGCCSKGCGADHLLISSAEKTGAYLMKRMKIFFLYLDVLWI